MRISYKDFLTLLIGAIILLSCNSGRGKNQGTKEANLRKPGLQSGPPTLLYKTRKDYSRQVAVILSPDKSTIVSYPHPTDVYYKSRLAYPTPLKNGYLLDNRGINADVAFLDITYEEYSKLEQPLTLAQMEKIMLDRNPLTELWDCGSRSKFKDEVKELNDLIESNNLSNCLKLK